MRGCQEWSVQWPVLAFPRHSAGACYSSKTNKHVPASQHPENLLAFAKTRTMENGDVTLVQRDGQLDSQNERERVKVFDKTLHFLQCAEMK